MLKANDLVRITSSFDIMKDAINYILNSQKDQTVLINELLEATRDAANPPFVVVEDDEGDNKSKRSGSGKSARATAMPDYSRLHRDFDSRLGALEDSQKEVDKFLIG